MAISTPSRGATAMGGAATPVSGADTTTYSEFYPAYSPDDALIAYTRLPDGQSSYDNPNSEFFVINAGGGTPIRHVANDPGMCLGKTSPGITNSWPKWSPVAVDGQRPDLLLDHLLVDAQREPAALRGGRHQGRDRPDHHDAGALPLEPAGGGEQPHAGLGHLLHSAQLRSGSRFGCIKGEGISSVEAAPSPSCPARPRRFDRASVERPVESREDEVDEAERRMDGGDRRARRSRRLRAAVSPLRAEDQGAPPGARRRGGRRRRADAGGDVDRLAKGGALRRLPRERRGLALHDQPQFSLQHHPRRAAAQRGTGGGDGVSRGGAAADQRAGAAGGGAGTSR